MKTFVKKAGLGLALGATAIGLGAAPAQAQRWHRGYHHYHHGNTAGAAVLGGIVGLGVGAAIASSNRDRYYDRGYYNGGYYNNGYYAQPGYYGYRRAYRPRCWTQWRWDPYYGGQVPVQVCR
jgi:hypothetical protein